MEYRNPRTAKLITGETIDAYGETNEGILTDAGTIGWHLVAAWLIVHEKSGRVLTIPLD